ncbi:hypothetical protein JS531_01300 [Bifidobacterium sp. CP2]|uniref:rhamnogalacturonan lyase family protein n=1 Tax=Bifidobacterium sp. CP2 TaxID=2809025 RepID=UPI001BDBC239|nr:hypothetical protein [Bifidobacterium sp. CP2]MBT1180633.1 hypothetical protein [Bifidobacterium sp. CP2]
MKDVRHAATMRRLGAALCAAGMTMTLACAPQAAVADDGGVASAAGAHATASGTGRLMENLARGVVAVRRNATETLVTWRLLAQDPSGIAFNVYRTSADGGTVRLNDAPLTGGTNLVDATADPDVDNTYRVVPVVDGRELTEQYGRGTGGEANSFTLKAGAAAEPIVRIPVDASHDPIAYLWPGDLDGDGEYDYVIDRQPEDTSTAAGSQKLEAYSSDGTFLWRVDLGRNSLDRGRIEGGSAAIDQGSADGVTVYDLDSDGKAEVAVRIANGTTFADGTTYEGLDGDVRQAIAVIDGETGTMRAVAPVPETYLADGPMYARFGVGYLDGRTPSLIAALKNRQDGANGKPNAGDFNLMYTAWDFDGTSLNRRWEWDAPADLTDDAHNIRIVDVDGDGRDETCSILFCLTPDGTLRQSFAASEGTHHGDRFYITDLLPDRDGLEGYAVQQLNPNGMKEYVYDPAYVGEEPGATLWKYPASSGEWDGVAEDVGRGMVGDIDPDVPGAEVWSSSAGLKNAATGETIAPRQAGVSGRIWPDMGVLWDGDLGRELLNSMTFNEWDPAAKKLRRITSASGTGLNAKSFGAVASRGGYESSGTRTSRPLFYGDLFGDWREEVVYTDASFGELVIFSTDQPTDYRVATLAQNPAYRNDMTVKGYMQDHELDYYLGFDTPLDADGQPITPERNVEPIGADGKTDGSEGTGGDAGGSDGSGDGTQGSGGTGDGSGGGASETGKPDAGDDSPQHHANGFEQMETLANSGSSVSAALAAALTAAVFGGVVLLARRRR